MAPPKRKPHKQPSTKSWFSDLLNKQVLTLNLKKLIFSPSYTWIAALGLLIVELILNTVVILRVPYTEIDWVAYMQEVEGVINGTYDYSKLRGDTGPLVYPAGFVWLYMGLYYITSQGSNILLAQHIFNFIYVFNLGLVFRILVISKKVPPYLLVFMSLTSYRIHSIFVLRLFNDPVAITFLYLALNLFISGRWSWGSLCYSLAVSVKMNILLYSPALLIAYLAILGLPGTMVQLSICAGVQLLLALPFLATFPLNYILGAFNLGRVFLFQWTVNWRFLPEWLFLNRFFHIGLLIGHLSSLAYCFPFWRHYLTSYSKLIKAGVGPESCQLLLLPLFMANLVGMMWARSLHYQFYVWYYHTLHYLAWCTPFPVKVRLLILGLIELCWNTYPSKVWSSLCLHICHITLFIGLVKQMKKSTEMTIFTCMDQSETEDSKSK